MDAMFANARAAYENVRFFEAEQLCQLILNTDPEHCGSISLLGLIRQQQKRFAESEQLIGRAIQLKSHDAILYFHHGKALQCLNRFDEALASYDRAIALKPDFAEALNNRGNVLQSLKRFEEAIVSYDRAISLKPDRSYLLNNRGNALMAVRRRAQAHESFSKAIALRPDFVEAYLNRANSLFVRNRYSEGLADCASVLRISPGHVDATRLTIAGQLMACDWSGLERQKQIIGESIEAGSSVVHPGDHRSFSDSEKEHLTVARNWIRTAALPETNVRPFARPRRGEKIRIAYLSSDFRLHAISFLIAGVFEHHDKSRFETVAMSLHPGDKSDVRKRITSACDQYISTHAMSDGNVVELIRAMKIDIAVNLNGLADGNRIGILAARPAPVQVNYLGYPGTMGAEFMDYIIADPIVIPESNRAYYSEKVVYLPHSYQPNDARRSTPVLTSSRSELGLPEAGFVFCCFNNTRKITRPIFAVWMRMLKTCPESMLWLLGDNPDAIGNLRREADTYGIAPSRLVFAPRTTPDGHLARQLLADLFLDTLPYNAHTTASDALWMGLPVLTCIGNTFSGRVATSLLYAIGLPELATKSLAEYEALGVSLARDPARLYVMKAKLTLNRGISPLFDTKRYTHDLEAAFAEMWERYQNGEEPRSFAVSKPGDGRMNVKRGR